MTLMRTATPSKSNNGAVKTNLIVALLVLASTARAEPVKKPSWQHAPGAIAGRWKATCPGADGLIVAFTVTDRAATGRIDQLGAAGQYGYTQGEEILRLTADDYGDWVGQLQWRSVAGVVRWDPIRLVATPVELEATMTTSECFRKLPRVAP